METWRCGRFFFSLSVIVSFKFNPRCFNFFHSLISLICSFRCQFWDHRAGTPPSGHAAKQPVFHQVAPLSSPSWIFADLNHRSGTRKRGEREGEREGEKERKGGGREGASSSPSRPTAGVSGEGTRQGSGVCVSPSLGIQPEAKQMAAMMVHPSSQALDGGVLEDASRQLEQARKKLKHTVTYVTHQQVKVNDDQKQPSPQLATIK